MPAPWQVFRDEELWTREVNLVFHDNAESLQRVFKRFAKQPINKVPFDRAIHLLTSALMMKLDKFDAIYCYGMALQTCVDQYK